MTFDPAGSMIVLGTYLCLVGPDIRRLIGEGIIPITVVEIKEGELNKLIERNRQDQNLLVNLKKETEKKFEELNKKEIWLNDRIKTYNTN